jgi:CRP-like cAMP-binding protein
MSLDFSQFDRFKVTFQKGDLIFCEYEPGDTFYLIQSGRVQIVKIMGEIEKIIDILHPGEIFGEMAILEEAPRSASVIAIEKVEALEFNKKNFEFLLRGNPQIALKLLQTFIKRIYDQKRRFMILTLKESAAKVADVFLMLSETQASDNTTLDERVIETSVDDIAHWCVISTGECALIIEHFANQRKIEMENDHIIVKNINDFRRFVNSRRKK